MNQDLAPSHMAVVYPPILYARFALLCWAVSTLCSRLQGEIAQAGTGETDLVLAPEAQSTQPSRRFPREIPSLAIGHPQKCTRNNDETARGLHCQLDTIKPAVSLQNATKSSIQLPPQHNMHRTCSSLLSGARRSASPRSPCQGREFTAQKG